MEQELDRAVAEKVMGHFACAEWESVYGGWLAGSCWMHKTNDHDGKGCFPANAPPKYSTSIKLAWEVVEKLNPQRESDLYVWRRFLAGLPEPDEFFSKTSEQAAEALCHAALTAVSEASK